ncbi:MAG: tyrosine--tRNA ligase [Candidatus Gracilibacteria bacterium]|jgi:tyrosyl-tRNA synthetase
MNKTKMSDVKNLLERGVVDVIVKEELEKKLKSGKKLRIKLGIDPTGSDLHIGHAVVLRKLKQFQDAGHTVILLIGDYTARIGDPTGKSEMRKMLTEKDIKENMKHYIDQAGKILNLKKLEIRHNSEWFAKMNMADILALTAKKTINQMLQREDFKSRFKNNDEVSMVEMLYPLMQGYDSVMLESDVEIGGTDQIFNMLVGRDMQKAYGCKMTQDVLTVPILEGLDGVEKMSKSLNNYVGIMEPAKEIYGKLMSIPDKMILRYFELATEISLQEIEKMEKTMKAGENPRNLKMQLAREIVTLYHDKKAAEEAEQEFINVFAKKELPENIELKKLAGTKWNIVNLLVETALASSKGEARRLIEGGGVKIDQGKVSSIEMEIDISKEKLIQVGKRRFLKVISK